MKIIEELTEFTAVNTFCMLLTQIDSDDKTQRKSLEEYYNYLRECIRSDHIMKLLDSNWMRWIGVMPSVQPSNREVKHE